MAAMQQEREVHDWEREVVDLKRQGLETADIAKAVDKHAATVRKAIAKARERGDLPEDPLVSAMSIEPGEQPASDVPPSDPYPGQTTVDDFTQTCEHGTPYDVDCEGCRPAQPGDDPLEQFRAEAGEAVGEMQPRPGEEPAGVLEDDDPLPVLPGTRQLALDLGPNAAPVHQATVKFTSEKWPSGFFGMGDVVTGTFTARIVNVPAKEAFDKDSEEFRAKPVAYGALITEISYEAVDPGE